MVVVSAITYDPDCPMPNVKKGHCTAQDAYTTNFGFDKVLGGVLTAGTASVIATLVISSGDGTINLELHDGTAHTTNTTVYFVVWGE